MTTQALRFLQTQQKWYKEQSECFFVFTRAFGRQPIMEFEKIVASSAEQAYSKGEEIGQWVDLWNNGVFPTLMLEEEGKNGIDAGSGVADTEVGDRK